MMDGNAKIDIKLRGIGKRYGERWIMQDLDLDVRGGELLVMLGPSGCGKSTLLRIIAGLEELSTGEIWMGGERITELAPRSRDIAMVFQSYALYPHMSVEGNMSLALRLKKLPPALIRQKVEAAADMLGIRELLGRKPRQLSGGQRQRVAMGRAIVRNPRAFLFDEPLSNLDAELRLVMRTEIKQLHQRLCNTMVYVTHDQVEAMTLADRLVIMRGGIIEQIGPPIEVFNHPQNLFVAGFIGTPPMNLLEARLDAEGLHCQGPGIPSAGAARVERLRLSPFGSTWAGPSTDTAVVWGVRPQHLAPCRHGSPHAGPRLCATVRLIEPLGTEMLVHTDWGKERLIYLAPFDGELRAGGQVELELSLANVHVFSASDGRSLGLRAPTRQGARGPMPSRPGDLELCPTLVEQHAVTQTP
jgi:multiple sugar transport system ATP-binding protein